jgi:flagellar hook-length control protein FliK
VLNHKSAEHHIVRPTTVSPTIGSAESTPVPKSIESNSTRTTSAPHTVNSVDNLRSTAKIPTESSENKSISGTQQNVISSPKSLNNPMPAGKQLYSADIPPPVSIQTKVSGEGKAEIVINGPERGSVPQSKPEQIKLIQTLLRVANARAELPAETLNRIQLAVIDPLFNKENSLKEIIAPLVQQIKQAVPQGKDNDALQIRQLLSAPALNLSSLQLLAPPAGQGLLGGLVALLQISLASRLLRNQPSQLDNIAQTLGSFITGANKVPSSAQAARGLADFFQLEQKHQLLKEIGRLLSGHQANKLTSAEQVIQGQDTFYYTLPSAFGDKLKDIELLIRRESESQEGQSDDTTDVTSWHLTMKLSVGELGELLTKAKLRPDHLEIDFYASNESTKEQVFNFLPLLKKRLEGLGIEVAKSQCQLGKIPSTLQQRPYQVFETKA